MDISQVNHISYNYTHDNYTIKLRKVENGWVLLKDNKEFVLKQPDEIIKFLEEKK